MSEVNEVPLDVPHNVGNNGDVADKVNESQVPVEKEEEKKAENEVMNKEEEKKEEKGEDAGEKQAEPPSTPSKPAPRKRYKEDFIWEEDVIGEGAFGEVKKAKDKETGVLYAIKILNKKHIIEQKKVEWVNREKVLLDRLRHPNIVNLYFTFSDPENLHFVLEFCPHGELLKHIKSVGCFDLECGKYYAAEVVSALEYMHSKGIAHRDIKPENILMGEGMHIKLIDFGTAREFKDRNDRSKSFVGTAEYVCPELLVDKKAGLSADLWSLGCMLYQFFAGRPPFKAVNEFLIFQLIQARNFIYPENFPDVARDLVEQLLELDPEKRLGNREPGGYAELKSHPFFDGIDWEKLHQTPPPPIKAPELLPVFPAPEKKEKVNESGDSVSNSNNNNSNNNDNNNSNDERAKKIADQKTTIWGPFLSDNELIVESSLVIKRKGFSAVKRQLILTDTPRIIYIDPQKMTVKGEIPWSNEITVDIKGSRHFNIVVPSRSYRLEELSGNSKKWADAIKNVKERKSK